MLATTIEIQDLRDLEISETEAMKFFLFVQEFLSHFFVNLTFFSDSVRKNTLFQKDALCVLVAI